MKINKYKAAQPVKDLNAKFEEWENMLVGKDKHSIRNQIYDMIWDSAVFQCINESRKYAAKDDKGNIKRNGMVHDFITQSFFKTQLFEYLDEPIASKETIEKLREFWEKYRRETEQWDIR